MSLTGTVTIVGAGPGSADLVTRAGWQALESADAVLYDALLQIEGFRSAAPDAQWTAVGKRAGQPSTEQAFIGRLMVNLAQQGKRVVRLKGGDPAMFGRLREELDALHDVQVPVRIIPGVTAASAAAATLQISLTEREIARSVCFLTPAQAAQGAPNGSWIQAALEADTSVIYMGYKQRHAICQALLAHGLDPETPVAVVENAGGQGFRSISTLGHAHSLGPDMLPGPVCMVIGEVVSGAVRDSVFSVQSAPAKAHRHAG